MVINYCSIIYNINLCRYIIICILIWTANRQSVKKLHITLNVMRTLLRPILIISIIVLLTGVQTVSPPFKSGDKDFIAYGKIYDPSMYPYLIRLIVNIDSRKFSVCSGSLISPLFVLTAAHCVHGKYKSTIKVSGIGDTHNYNNNNNNILTKESGSVTGDGLVVV